MINKTLLFTSLFSALFMTLSLKFLQLFSFIKWSPIGWTKEWGIFTSNHYLVKWTVLFLALFIVFALLYIGISFLTAVPPAITAILIGVVGIIVLEWFISESRTFLDTVKSISIPLLAVVAIVLRFIAGTAVFKPENSRKV